MRSIASSLIAVALALAALSGGAAQDNVRLRGRGPEGPRLVRISSDGCTELGGR
jgi:hypothetical protein